MITIEAAKTITPESSDWKAGLIEWHQAAYFSLDIETFGASQELEETIPAPAQGSLFDSLSYSPLPTKKRGGKKPKDSGDGLNPWRGMIRLIQIGLPSGNVLVFDCGPALDRLEIGGSFRDLLQKKLADPQIPVIGHNIKFDLLWIFVKYGFKARAVRDTMLASEVYWAGLGSGLGDNSFRHSLKALAERLGFGEVDKTEQSSNWGVTKLSRSQIDYAVKDARLVMQCWNKLWEMCKEANLEKPVMAECLALPGFVEMEALGMPVDREMLESILIQYQDAAKDAINPFHAAMDGGVSDDGHGVLFGLGIKVNPDSSAQVVEALNRKFGLNLTSSAQESLAPYWSNQAIRALSLYRTLNTCIGYIKGALEAEFGGAVRGYYDQLGPQGFGRSTCRDNKTSSLKTVNLQNPPGGLPKDLDKYNLPPIRSAFRPPEGYSLLVADLSQAHTRIAAEASGDMVIRCAYRNGLDMHLVTAQSLARQRGLGKEWTAENMAKWKEDKSHPNHAQTTHLRNVSKKVFYGSLNGQGAKTLQSSAEMEGIQIDFEDARNAIKAWKNTYKGLHSFMKKLVEDSRNSVASIQPESKFEYAEVRGLSGRRLFMPKFFDQKSENEKAGVKLMDVCAFYWQSTEADIMKLATGSFLLVCDQHPEWEATIRNFCHDELDVVCKSEYALEVAEALQHQMHTTMRMFLEKIPVDDLDAKAEKLIVKSWADK